MARIVVYYPLQNLRVHQRAIEESRGHGSDRWEGERELAGWQDLELTKLSLKPSYTVM